ncbi:hypothetical protein B0T26DRAFT_688876 [Lasiosphaeria miniovina]|uniref:Uncharacterized protein n=1 Tax=Lasiosphaeria miniovina TaxID=1954250 RepID=A0AA40BI89_9PEZI|nr:uncharacterized protein B0T26DRAFT_688876 [Lasiosphaeria miniovina]KAK0734543.1 hypothetical protein B0T26DRAFT_688876 [Lasiosphaeria miniovina]
MASSYALLPRRRLRHVPVAFPKQTLTLVHSNHLDKPERTCERNTLLACEELPAFEGGLSFAMHLLRHVESYNLLRMPSPALRQAMRETTHSRRYHGPNASRPRVLCKIAATAAICSGIAALPMAAAVRHPHAALDVAEHLAAGISVAASAAIPPLRSSDFIDNGYWAMAYAAWGTAVSVLFVLELMQRPNNLQRRLFGGTVLFSTLSLLGSLSQSAESTIEGVLNWFPMAFAASLCVVPVLMDAADPQAAAEMVANLAGVYVRRDIYEHDRNLN